MPDNTARPAAPMDYSAVDEAIRSGRARETLPALCLRAMADIDTGRLALAAVRHPLGFLCLPVYRDGVHGVCVHVWAPGLARARPTTSDTHAHSWDLVSFVLYGGVGNALIQVEDDPDGPWRIFEIHSHADVDELRATPRRVTPASVSRDEARAGTSYRLAAGRFHATDVPDGAEVATVVLGLTRAGLDLSLGPLDLPSHQVSRQRCDAAETAAAARLVLTGLGG
jgi:hypothetical protein